MDPSASVSSSSAPGGGTSTTSTASTGTTRRWRWSPSPRPRSPGSTNASTRSRSRGSSIPRASRSFPRRSLPGLVCHHEIDEVVLAYSDLSSDAVMAKAAWVHALGPDFTLLGPQATQIASTLPVIAVLRRAHRLRQEPDFAPRSPGCCATWASGWSAIRHPMPYGDLVRQGVQRFATLEDLEKHECTIEEMEEYEPHIVQRHGRLRRRRLRGDPARGGEGGRRHRLGRRQQRHSILPRRSDDHGRRPAPSRGTSCTTTRDAPASCTADVLVINKIDTARPRGVEQVRANVRAFNPRRHGDRGRHPGAASTIRTLIRGQRVLVVEDGPTLTHGGHELRGGNGGGAQARRGRTGGPATVPGG